MYGKEGNKWDNYEIYFVANGLKKVFPKLSFILCSYYSGILNIRSLICKTGAKSCIS